MEEMKEDAASPTEEVKYVFPLGPVNDDTEDFLTLAVKNEPTMRCLACGEKSGKEWLFSFQQRGVDRGKEIIFCPICFTLFLETSIQLYLRIRKGKAKVGMKLVDRKYLPPIFKKEREDA